MLWGRVAKYVLWKGEEKFGEPKAGGCPSVGSTTMDKRFVG